MIEEKKYRLKLDTTSAIRSLKNFQRFFRRFDKNVLKKFDKISVSLRHAFGSSSRSTLNRFLTDAKLVDKQLGRIATNAGRVNRKMRGGIKPGASQAKIKGGVNLWGVGAKLGGAYGAYRIAKSSISSSFDFNEKMAKIGTLIPGQIARLHDLKSGIEELSITYGKSVGDIAEGTYAAISAWGDSPEILKRMEVAIEASQAGIATTEETMALLASITSNWGDSSAEATEKIADLAFVTNKLGVKAPFGEMAASLGKVAPLAKQIGIPLEEMFATLAAGAGVIGNVPEVSTQMRSLYTSVIRETPAMTKVLKKYNNENAEAFETATDLMRGIGTLDFLKYLKKTTNSTKGFQKVLGGRTEGFILAMSLLGGRTDKYNEALTEMLTKTGQLKVAFREYATGINKVGYEWKKSTQSAAALGREIGDKLSPILATAIGGIREMLGLAKTTRGISAPVNKVLSKSPGAIGRKDIFQIEQSIRAQKGKISTSKKDAGWWISSNERANIAAQEKRLRGMQKSLDLVIEAATYNNQRKIESLSKTKQKFIKSIFKQKINIKIDGSKNPTATGRATAAAIKNAANALPVSAY